MGFGISLPWDDECPQQIEIDEKTYTLTKGPTPDDNVLWGAYASWTCTYQASDGSIHMDTHRRVLWVFDF